MFHTFIFRSWVIYDFLTILLIAVNPLVWLWNNEALSDVSSWIAKFWRHWTLCRNWNSFTSVRCGIMALPANYKIYLKTCSYSHTQIWFTEINEIVRKTTTWRKYNEKCNVSCRIYWHMTISYPVDYCWDDAELMITYLLRWRKRNSSAEVRFPQ